jgi:di/tricarboxylate transporter
VATAPNTIVFGAGGLSSLDMARRGWKLNVLSTLAISMISWLLLR